MTIGKAFGKLWSHGARDSPAQSRRGQVVLIQPNATVDGLTAPQVKKMPKPPNLRVPVGRPILRWLQRARKPQRAWADYQSLFEDGLAKVRAFELQLQTLPVSNPGRAKSHPQKSGLNSNARGRRDQEHVGSRARSSGSESKLSP